MVYLILEGVPCSLHLEDDVADLSRNGYGNKMMQRNQEAFYDNSVAPMREWQF